MELNATLIALQSVLKSTSRATDDFVKIKYKGGNEMKISTIVHEIEKFLSKEGYLDNREVNKQQEQKVREIVFFLALNCDYNEELKIKDCEHLIGITLKLSKCLFANVIVELNLVNSFTSVLDKFPLAVQAELLHELISCLKKIDSNLILFMVSDVVTAVIQQLNNINVEDRKVREDVERLEEVSAEMLGALRGFQQSISWKSSEVYRQMGYRLLKLLNMLLLCDSSKECLHKLIEMMINICCDIVIAITIDVFCEWAEVEEKGENLQTTIASTAYYTVQKYQNYEPATHLIKMLSTIAKKPKSLQEIIQQADSSKMIAMIETNDANQKRWFQALLHTQVFANEKSLACVERHYDLCDEAEVDRLLNLCGGKEIDGKKLRVVLKCAAMLSADQLAILITRYLRRFGTGTPLNGRYNREELVVLLNKMKEKKDDFVKDVLLLLLQNPRVVLSDLYSECLKNSLISENLKSTFASCKEIVVIDDMIVNCLKNLITTEVLGEHYQHYKTLLQVLLATKSITYDKVINDLLSPFAKSLLNDENYTCLLYLLCILNEIYTPKVLSKVDVLINEFFNTLTHCRCTFFEFNQSKQDVTRECVKFFLNCEELVNQTLDCKEKTLDSYYLNKVYGRLEEQLFDYLFPTYSEEEYYKFVCLLVKVLPSCIVEEWKQIASSLEVKSGTMKMVQILTDVLILLCQVTNNQSENTVAIGAFKYCLSNYMIVLKEKEQSSVENQITVAKCACRLLREMPLTLLHEDAYVILGLMTDSALASLSEDRQFVCGLLAIGDKKIAQYLAQKMLK